ncbi:MAG: hypothetical protein K1W37_01350 [Lachnospiraceae bacterium]|jgi:hypothetical protein
MKIKYDTYTAFLYPITGRAGTPLFYTLMLHNRSQKSLAASGFADVFLQEIRIYTYPRQNGVLLRNIPQAKKHRSYGSFPRESQPNLPDIGKPGIG